MIRHTPRRFWTPEEDAMLTEFCRTSKISSTEIGLRLNRTRYAISGRIRDLGLSNDYIPRIYTKDDNFFSQPNPLNCYFAGFLAADGSVNWEDHCVRWSLEKGDVSALEAFQNATGYTGRIGSKVNYGLGKNPSHQRFLDIYSAQQWCKDLHRNFGIVPQKTHRLAPPNTVNDLLNACFILGYIDGDGSVSFTDGGGKAISITSASPLVLEFIRAFVDRHFPTEKGATSTVRNYDQYFMYGVSANRAIHLFDFLRALPVPKLARKWENPEILRVVNARKARRPDLFNYQPLSFDSSGMIRRHANVESAILAEVVPFAPVAVTSEAPSSLAA